ncbi:hypothetical protein PQ692_14410 (plasmid) [Thermoanaerobacterium thermosaccharolyticum]|uniref:hypothetical protein n=1 Tax=Thermoanaerobacterium thermosaccharolyticum TaxID=1517 RepID=UPI003DA9E04B
MKKIIVEVERGLVTNIYANFMDVKVLVVDHDTDLSDPDGILSLEELQHFKGKDKFVSVDFVS